MLLRPACKTPSRLRTSQAWSRVLLKLMIRSAASGYLQSRVWGAVASSTRSPAGIRTPSRLSGSLEQWMRSTIPCPAGCAAAFSARRRRKVDFPQPGPALISQGLVPGSAAAWANQPEKPEGARAPRKKSAVMYFAVFCMAVAPFCMADKVLRETAHSMRFWPAMTRQRPVGARLGKNRWRIHNARRPMGWRAGRWFIAAVRDRCGCRPRRSCPAARQSRRRPGACCWGCAAAPPGAGLP